MSAIRRFTDIINANINSVLEQAEDPAKLVRLAIQEMQDSLVEIRATSARYMAERQRIARRLRQAKAQVEDWQSKAELAIERGRDDLARAALKERNELEASTTAMEAELKQLDDAGGKLKTDADRLESKLQQAKARRDGLIARGKAVKSRAQVKRHLHNVNYDAAISRFESYERKLDELEGSVEAYEMGNTNLSDEIERLNSDDSLTEELEALKSRIQQRGSVAAPTPA